jgi:beta-lactamase superfamily II metal-dependent hydrolase
MGSAGTLDEALLGPATQLSPRPDELALFVLNVGDGDGIVLRLPDDDGGESYAVIDAYSGKKTVGLLDALGARDLRFVCATHPHIDHIAGLGAVLKRFDGCVRAFWDAGFRHTSVTYGALMEEVERQRIALLRPTSGFETYVGKTRISVLSPSIYLRNRYDTYGVDANNASIVLRIAYPERPPNEDYPAEDEAEASLAAPSPPTRTLILGGDAQTDAWGRVFDEFPHFVNDQENWARAIRVRTGRQPLACDFFKVSHHGSKHGVNLELIERLGDRSGSGTSKGPSVLVTSSATGKASGDGFPHRVAQELLREVREPLAKIGTDTHQPDGALGIHHTAQELAPPGGGSAGSVAFVVAHDGAMRLYRFGDDVGEPVDLTRARPVTNIH